MSFQGGDHCIDAKLYKLALPFIRDNDLILNLGCGFKFIFEESLSKAKNVIITSVDFPYIPEKPPFIKELIKQSVEDEFLLEKKFDVVTFFELIEHIDKTDVLLKNCYKNLKDDGLLIFSFPNLASIYSRIELLLGYQPHLLEVSNEVANFGSGIFGKFNNPKNELIHHIRGITYKAMKELAEYSGFRVLKTIGYDHYHFKRFFKCFPSVAPVNLFVCRKK